MVTIFVVLRWICHHVHVCIMYGYHICGTVMDMSSRSCVYHVWLPYLWYCDGYVITFMCVSCMVTIFVVLRWICHHVHVCIMYGYHICGTAMDMSSRSCVYHVWLPYLWY